MNDLLKQDKKRTKKLPRFQILLRKAQRGGITSLFYRLFYRLSANRSHIEISPKCKIGGDCISDTLIVLQSMRMRSWGETVIFIKVLR